MLSKWILFDAMGVIFKVGDDTNDLLVPYVQKINPDYCSLRCWCLVIRLDFPYNEC